MAKIGQGILGGFSGRVGTVVGYCRGGAWFVRAYRPHINDRKSEVQLAQRSRFKAMILAASELKHAIRLGLKEMGDREGLTEGNCFLRLNKDCYTPVDGGMAVDYRRLALATGNHPGVRFGRAQVEGTRVSVRYELNMSAQRARLSDRVQVVAYAPALRRCIVAGQVERAAGEVSFVVPDEWVGEALHLYGFTVGRDGRCSQSEYIDSEGIDTECVAEVDEAAAAGGGLIGTASATAASAAYPTDLRQSFFDG